MLQLAFRSGYLRTINSPRVANSAMRDNGSSGQAMGQIFELRFEVYLAWEVKAQ